MKADAILGLYTEIIGFYFKILRIGVPNCFGNKVYLTSLLILKFKTISHFQRLPIINNVVWLEHCATL